VPSLRKALAGIGEPKEAFLAVRGSFGGRTPASLRGAIAGMTNPHVQGWHEVGVALASENTDESEEAQGATTDGTRWYVGSNGTKTVVVFDDDANRLATFEPELGIVRSMWADAGKPAVLGAPDTPIFGTLPSRWSPHFGAPSYHGGWLYVPVQGPHGVWKIPVEGGAQEWHKADAPAGEKALPDDDLFPWCAVHPVTGVLYTCNYGRPHRLRAYDRLSLVRAKQHDVRLGTAPIDLDRVQGGVFTSRGRLILVRSDFNAVFCFSSLNGFCFGAKKLGDFGSDGSEVESVTIRGWSFDGVKANVHILELDNDIVSEDDFYLHSFQVPDPARL